MSSVPNWRVGARSCRGRWVSNRAALRTSRGCVRGLRCPAQAVSSQPKPTRAGPRLALRMHEAAEALGVSVDYFADHIAPEVRMVRNGRTRLVPVSEIQAWLERNAAYATR